MELHLSVLKERKNIFLTRLISAWLISARQHGAVMAFIPYPRSLININLLLRDNNLHIFMSG